jgi:hypothetical protein
MNALDRRAELAGLSCDHLQFAECCDGCGHFSCPDCGLYWDDGADGGGPFADDLYDADPGGTP